MVSINLKFVFERSILTVKFSRRIGNLNNSLALQGGNLNKASFQRFKCLVGFLGRGRRGKGDVKF